MWDKQKLTGAVALVLFVAAFASGCKTINHVSVNAKLVGDVKQSAIKHHVWNSSYWSPQNPNYLEPQLLSTDDKSLTVKLIGAGIPGGSKTEKIYIGSDTTIWKMGKMITYSFKSRQINPGDNFTVIVEKRGSQQIAKQIYGPDSQVYGIIQSVIGNFVTVKELKQTMDANNLKDYSGHVMKLEFDSRTNFQGGSPSDLLVGYMLQAQVSGTSTDGMLMFSGNISIGKKLPNGIIQWSDIIDSNK